MPESAQAQSFERPSGKREQHHTHVVPKAGSLPMPRPPIGDKMATSSLISGSVSSRKMHALITGPPGENEPPFYLTGSGKNAV